MDPDAIRREDQPERIKLLSEVDVFEPLGVEQIARLSPRILDRSFQKDSLIYVPDDPSGTIFVLLTGRIRLYTIAARQECTFDLLQAGTIFGEASLAGRAHSEYAQAVEPTLVGLLDLNTFWQLVSQNPKATASVMKLLVTRSSKYRIRLTDIALKGVLARLAGLILELIQDEGVVTREGHYKIDFRYTHEQLSTMIGAKRVSVSRAFKTLQDTGCLWVQRRRIMVLDLARLAQLAVEG
jgi:CRP/FNR family transcriptional regulator, cyclic AMP receptor protein